MKEHCVCVLWCTVRMSEKWFHHALAQTDSMQLFTMFIAVKSSKEKKREKDSERANLVAKYLISNWENEKCTSVFRWIIIIIIT